MSQATLPGLPAPTSSARAWATFDPSQAYRFTLGRCWDAAKPRLAWIMLNPSTADEHKLDPTVRRCQGFAKAWGYGSFEVGNLFALRSTDPAAVKRAPGPAVGPGNDEALAGIAGRADRVVVAWGNHGTLLSRGRHVAALLEGRGVALWCLGVTQEAQPVHPLYVPADRELAPFHYAGPPRRPRVEAPCGHAARLVHGEVRCLAGCS